ncbi:MAG: hydantoinase/oxoprolinase family protein, partial [Candidatus Thorarchaeota archaeon]
MSRYRVAVDIGGTFTDLVVIDEDSGDILTTKVASTPQEPAKAVIEAFSRFLEKIGNAEVSVIVHGTTIATNALLGQMNLELPRTALITTEGFRDIIEIGRQRRHRLYNLFIRKPHMLIPRKLRFEVEERIGPEGRVLTPLNREQVGNLTEQLKGEDVKSVAVALLFSYRNERHELEIGEILERYLPEVCISLSSRIAPEYREYERTSTAVVNAVLMPIVSRYLDDLEREIGRLGFPAPLCIMHSDGGIGTKNIASKKPVGMVESGPAAGVIASAFYGRTIGVQSILSFDMGGTTAKAGAIQGATPEVVKEYEVAGEVHSGRIVKGSGYPVMYPFIDLAECSAGGGTIAWVDEGKALRVGPISAGAEPGPACYGKGGSKPTVTDANVVLGRLNPQYLLGGSMKIFPKLSEKAILEEICGKIRLELKEAAAGIVKIANLAMSKILRIVSLERGHDPRKFVLMSFGGAGPMHACALAEELQIEEIIVPYSPGLFSAYGLLSADFRNNFAKTIMELATEVDVKKVEDIFKNLELQGSMSLERQKVPKSRMRFVRQMDMRYFGQSYELTIPTSHPFTQEVLNGTVEGFHRKHKAIYGFAVKEETVELVNAKVMAVGIVDKPKLKKQALHGKDPPSEALTERRDVFFEKDNTFVETSIFSRERLRAGNAIEGPAVIEQYDS